MIVLTILTLSTIIRWHTGADETIRIQVNTTSPIVAFHSITGGTTTGRCTIPIPSRFILCHGVDSYGYCNSAQNQRYHGNGNQYFEGSLNLLCVIFIWINKWIELKVLDRCAQLFDRERFLIMNKHTEILDCIPCVMVLLIHSASRAQISTATCQTLECPQTDRRHQTYYLPCFAVDKEWHVHPWQVGGGPQGIPYSP